MNTIELMQAIQQATLAARESDQFAHRGQIAVAIKKGRAQVQRITYDDQGNSTVTHKGNFVPLNLVALHLTAESQCGVL